MVTIAQAEHVVQKHELLTDGRTLSPNGFAFRNDAEVRIFLSGHPHLQPLLDDAHQQIRVYFPDSPCCLEVIHDPEATGRRQLALLIRTPLAVPAAFKKLKEFDNSWWLPNLSRAQGDLCITLEFE